MSQHKTLCADYGCGKGEQAQGHCWDCAAGGACLCHHRAGAFALPVCLAHEQHACAHQKYARFEAKIGEDNEASLKLFADAGFVRTRYVAAFKEVTMVLEADQQRIDALHALLQDHVQRGAYD